MSKPTNSFYEFGPFRLDTTERLLLRDGHPVPLTSKAYEMLLALVQRSGHIVEKSELLREIWPDSFVEEGNLTQHVFSLRKALGENRAAPHYIETIPRRGYRFVASVRELPIESAAKTEKQNLIGAASTSHVADSSFFEERSNTVSLSRQKWNSMRIGLAGVLLMALTGAIFLILPWNKKHEAAANLQIRSVAVLPFKPIGNDEADESLGAGMAEAVVSKLVSVRELTVRPASAVQPHAGGQTEPVQIGRELGVDAVLTGKIQRAAGRVRVTVELTHTLDGSTVWSGSFDEVLTNLFAVQDAIAERVAGALALKITPTDRERLNKRYTQNPEAYQKYLLGRYFFDRSGVSGAVEKSIDYYQQAIKLEPRFALAYAGLADAYSLELGYPSSPAARLEAHDKVQTAALKALEIDETLADAHTALGRLAFYDWNWQDAEREYQRAIELDPNSAIARLLYGWYLVVMGRTNAGIAELRRGVTLDPLSVNLNITLGAYLTTIGQYDEAIEQLQKTVALSPTSLWPRIRLAQAYEMKGDRDRAIAEFQQTIDLFKNTGQAAPAEMRFAQANAFWGERNRAMELVRKVRSPSSANDDYDLAVVYAGMGQRDQAFEILERVYKNHNMNLLSMITDPRLASFRTDPRYASLMQRLGLNSQKA